MTPGFKPNADLLRLNLNITRDVEIKNKLTVTRGEGRGKAGESMERVVKEQV